MDPDDQTASLMTPAKLAQVSAARVPVSPAAFLDQMAADVGHQHLRRLGELREVLQALARQSSAAGVEPSVEQLAHAVPALDVGQLEARGLWAGLTGKTRSAGAAFAASFDTVEQAAQAMATGVVAAQKAQQPHAVAAERALVECEVEVQALDKIIDQGARWLQGMRNQLKERGLQAGDDAGAGASLAHDEARCEVLVERLKALRAVAGAAQQAHQQALATAERRSAVTLGAQQVLASDVKAWRARMGKLAAGATEGKAPGALEGARDLQEQLQQRLAAVLADCAQLRTHEGALDAALAAMGERVASVG